MALSAVKATKATSATGTSVTMTNLTATAGNALIVGASGYEADITTGAMLAVRTGDTFTTDTEGNTSAATDVQRIGIASAPNVGAGPTSLVATVTLANGVVAFALEVGGPPTSSILDASSPAIKIGTSTSASTNNLTNVTPDAIFVAMVGTEAGGNPITLTTGGSFTDNVGATTMKETNANSFPASGMGFRIVSATGAIAGAWTVDNADWGGIIAVYKDAGGAPPPVVEAGRRRTLTGAGI